MYGSLHASPGGAFSVALPSHFRVRIGGPDAATAVASGAGSFKEGRRRHTSDRLVIYGGGEESHSFLLWAPSKIKGW